MKTIFVSSTFADMQVERNLLHTRIMPEVNSKLQKKGDHVQFLDFRWGVNTENLNEDAAMKKVLSTCFDGISNSSYVLVFIGEKYGTSVPYPIMHDICQKYGMDILSTEKSITELEVNFAIEKDTINTNNVLFYFKHNENTENVDPKVLQLKEHIKELYPTQVRYYDGDLSNNSKMFVDELVNDITNLLSKENETFSCLSDNLSQNYALHWSSRERLMESAIQNVLSNGVTVVYGPSGCGKTVFMSALREKIKYDAHTHIEFVSKTAYTSKNIKNEVWNLLGVLHSVYGQTLNNKCFGNNYDDTIDEMCKVLRTLVKNKPFVVFVDGIDKFETIHELTEALDFVHKFQFDIKFVISCDDPNKYVITPEAKYIFLDHLSEEDKLRTISHELNLSQKSLDEKSKISLLNKTDSVFPLYIRLAIKRLVMMQEDDYKKINEEKEKVEFISTHICDIEIDVASIINNYIFSIIETFPDDIENMIVDFFEFATRAVDDRGFAINVAAFMTASLRGYTDTELLLLIDKMGFFAHPEWFSFRNQSIAVITNHNFPLKFAECDLYCFRKYLEDIVYQDHINRNVFENTIIKTAVYDLYNCNRFCDRSISKLFDDPYEERIIPDIEIAAANFRKNELKQVFPLIASIDNCEDINTINLITTLFVDAYLKNPFKYENNFFAFARKHKCDVTTKCVHCCITKLLPVIINSAMSPFPFVSFFEKCLIFLREELDYSKVSTRLFLHMSKLNIAIMLKNGGYIKESAAICNEVLQKMKAIPKKLRNDIYYEALKEVNATIENIDAFLLRNGADK